ncbi:MAG: T9SS type A sorting domain-containing protein [Flavobacteriales bacterium]|nr:T9SS type A sorting domain-containing protein [Flavobacteriales bacterium]
MNNVGSEQRDIQWTAHFAQTPTMSGSLTAAEVPGHIETFDGTDHVSINGDGSVALRTLLPAASSTTRIGGDGYAYWVDGADHPPTTVIDTATYTPGKWRIEVRPQTVTDSVVFLHTIRTGDGTNVAQPGGEVLTSAITIGVDWSDTLTLFAADGNTGVSDHVVYDVVGTRLVHVMAMDLADDTYCLWVNGSNVATLTTDSNGVARSSWFLGLGLHEIGVGSCSVGLPDASDEGSVTAYFEPHAQAFIIGSAGVFTSATLFDATGRQVRSEALQGAGRIPCPELSAGVYVLVLTGEGRPRMVRCVVE